MSHDYILLTIRNHVKRFYPVQNGILFRAKIALFMLYIVQICMYTIPIEIRYPCMIVNYFKNVSGSDGIYSMRNIKLTSEGVKLVPLFIRLMTPNGAIWSLDPWTVIMR